MFVVDKGFKMVKIEQTVADVVQQELTPLLQQFGLDIRFNLQYDFLKFLFILFEDR